MQSRVRQGIVTVFFFVLLAITKYLGATDSDNSTSSQPPPDAQSALARYGFHLREVAKASGIDFVHQVPKLDPKLDHIMPEITAMGASVSVVDFDRDGWQDMYVTDSKEGSQNRLYRNRGNGTFQDVAGAMGVADANKVGTGVSMGSVWGDFNNDGYEDLFVYKWGHPELFRNDKGRKFTRVTETAGLPRWLNANSAIWLDYDRDSKLDLFIGGYYPENINLWQLKHTVIMPDSFEYAQNGGRKYLLRNVGNGKFEDVTMQMGIDSNRWALAVAAADLRGTGYPDIMIANDYGVSELWVNDKGKRFREMGKEAFYWNKLAHTGPKSGMNVSFGDIMNDGKYAAYVSNISEEGILIQGNNLWVPSPRSTQTTLRYDNLANDLGVEIGGWSFGAQFGDLNNDGTQDLYLTNGYISLDRNGSYWYDFSKITGSHSSIISDAKNWPPLQGRSHSGYQRKRVWLNDGAGKFREVAQAVGAKDTYDGRAVALADFSNSGSLDVVVANQRGPLLLYKNTVAPENQWVQFELEGAQSNRSAIGAQVRVFWNGQQQVQELHGGSGFCAQNQRRLHFGLGKSPKIEKVVIRWPSGKVQTLNAPRLNQVNRIKEAV